MLVGSLESEDVEPSFIRGLKRSEYEQLALAGAFQDEKVELLNGQIVAMSPEGLSHRDANHWFFKRLVRAFEDSEFEVFHAAPYAADDYSLPEPDIYVGRPGRQGDGYPNSTSVLWLVEISNTSLRKDRRIKASIYARSGVEEYWIVDISGPTPVVEVYTEATDGKYASVGRYRDGDVIRPKLVPIDIAVADIPR